MSKNKKRPKKPKSQKFSLSKEARRNKFLELMEKMKDVPMPTGPLAVPATTTTYLCATEEDGTPGTGCGHKFMTPWPTSTVKCPKCGNYWVKWVYYDQREEGEE